MIYTITLNPSLDVAVEVSDLKPGRVNRTDAEALYPGGKGINVSIMLTRLGIENQAWGFSAGFTGEQIEAMLLREGCDAAFIRLDTGYSRINMKIRAERETEINGRGPAIPPEAVDGLFERLRLLEDGDTLVLGGSIPGALPHDMYERILRLTTGKSVHAVVDTTGESLEKALPYRPFLVKPNHHELGELFGVTLESLEQTEDCARRVQAQGARNVLVSMADKGALLLDEEGRLHRGIPPRGEAVSAVGAGDSMVAGFLAGYARTGDYALALELGIAAGSATTFSPWLADKPDIRALLDRPEAYGL